MQEHKLLQSLHPACISPRHPEEISAPWKRTVHFPCNATQCGGEQTNGFVPREMRDLKTPMLSTATRQ